LACEQASTGGTGEGEITEHHSTCFRYGSVFTNPCADAPLTGLINSTNVSLFLRIIPYVIFTTPVRMPQIYAHRPGIRGYSDTGDGNGAGVL
jgi:hypothetical protein